MILSMEKGNLQWLMEIFMKVYGLIIKKMDSEYKILMVIYIKVILFKINLKALVSFNKKMEIFIKVHGKIIWKMVKEELIIKMEVFMMDNG